MSLFFILNILLNILHPSVACDAKPHNPLTIMLQHQFA